MVRRLIFIKNYFLSRDVNGYRDELVKSPSTLQLVANHCAADQPIQVQREAVGCLAELAEINSLKGLVCPSPDGVQKPLAHQLGLMLQSESDSIASYAAYCLHKMPANSDQIADYYKVYHPVYNPDDNIQNIFCFIIQDSQGESLV